MKLKTLDRINNMMDEGHIKKIYVDGWNRIFLNKIYELFGNKVEVCEFRLSDRFINKMQFEEGDCILVDDLFIKDYKKYDALIQKAKLNGVFIKILTEDIYNVETLRDTANNIKGYDYKHLRTEELADEIGEYICKKIRRALVEE